MIYAVLMAFIIGFGAAFVLQPTADDHEHQAYMKLKAENQGLHEDIADLKEQSSFGCVK
jgi:hypothetical protein